MFIGLKKIDVFRHLDNWFITINSWLAEARLICWLKKDWCVLQEPKLTFCCANKGAWLVRVMLPSPNMLWRGAQIEGNIFSPLESWNALYSSLDEFCSSLRMRCHLSQDVFLNKNLSLAWIRHFCVVLQEYPIEGKNVWCNRSCKCLDLGRHSTHILPLAVLVALILLLFFHSTCHLLT